MKERKHMVADCRGRGTKEGQQDQQGRQTVGRQTGRPARQAQHYQQERQRGARTGLMKVGSTARTGRKKAKRENRKKNAYLGVSISPFKRDTAQSEVVKPIVVQLDTAAMKGESVFAGWTSDVA
jgi:hypothetical protein